MKCEKAECDCEKKDELKDEKIVTLKTCKNGEKRDCLGTTCSFCYRITQKTCDLV